jgi:LemA protein
MKRIGLWIFLAIVAIALMSGCGSYNSMVDKREAVKAQWQNVEVVYQRRADLIPNLVNTVKGVAEFEKSTLTAVVEARANATRVTIDPDKLTPENIQKFEQAQGAVSTSLGRLLAVAESYPNLRATESFAALMTQLEGTENRISTERRKFNEMAQDYNAYIQKFPRNIWAGMFGFAQYGYFHAAAGSDKAPEVKF